MFGKIKALFKARRLAKEAAKEVTVDGQKKPGYKTTEFWLTLLANLPMIACTLKGQESLPCIVAGVLATISYHWQRGTLKGTLLKVGKDLAKEAPKE